jgi:hypothetical protein
MAIVDVFNPCSNRSLPWTGRAVDCGIRVCSQTEFNTLAVPIQYLVAPAMVVPLTITSGNKLWITISCNTEGPEPEYWLDADREDKEEGMFEEDEELLDQLDAMDDAEV